MHTVGKLLASGIITASLFVGGGTPIFAQTQDMMILKPDSVELDQHTEKSVSEEKYKKKKYRFKKHLDKMSQILGMSSDELTAELKAGKSLAEVAKAKGISEDKLIEKMKDSLTEDLRKIIHKKRTEPMNSGDQTQD